MRNKDDMLGLSFGVLTVVAEAKNESHRQGRRWVCRCVCGAEVVLTPSDLLGNKGRFGRRSCGKPECRQVNREGLTKYEHEPHNLSAEERAERDAARAARAANMKAIREMVRHDPNYGRVQRREVYGAD